MSKRHPSKPTVATPTNALQRFLNTAELVTLVPALPARTLQRVVAAVGLEDSGSLLIYATGDQLLTLMDADLWRRDGGAAECLDPLRFGRWLQVMVDADLAAAVAKLQELDQDLVIGALAHHIGVGSRASAERRGLLESVSTWECGTFVVWARLEEAWDAVSAILTHAQGEQPAWFRTVMAACRDLSYEHLEEASGFDDLAGHRDQAWHDMAYAREERREAQGYVTRHAAQAFLAAARRCTADDLADLSEAQAYMRTAQTNDGLAAVDAPHHRVDGASLPGHDDATRADVARLTELVDALDGSAPVRGLLPGGSEAPRAQASGTGVRLAALASRQDARLDRWHQELGFLSNCLMESGLLPQSRASESDAVAAAIATCDLGFETLDTSGDHAALEAVSPVSAFRLGWSRLHRDIGLAVASALLRSLTQILLERSEFHEDVRALRRKLHAALERDRPWDVVSQLDVIAILDPPTWATLTCLLAEFPVAPLGCLEPSPRRRLRVTNDVEFIASLAHLRWVSAFAGQLTDSLSESV